MMTWHYGLFLSGLIGLTALLSLMTFMSARVLKHLQPRQNLLLLPGENLMRLGVIGICLGLSWLSGLPAEILGWRFADWTSQVKWGIWTGLGLALFFSLVTQWLVQRTDQRFYSTLVLEHIVPKTKLEVLLTLLALGSAVLLEELLFRSLLLGGLSPILPLPLLLIGVSIFFGLLHSPQGLWGMVGTGLAGFILGFLFIWQGSILMPVVAHYVTNVVQIGLAMRSRRGDR